MGMTPNGTVSLLDADPELGQLLSGARLQLGRSRLVVHTHTLPDGPWDAERLRVAGPEHVGLLMLDGLIAREVVLADNVSCELLGPGDLVRPWQLYDPSQLVPAQVRWTSIGQSRLAVLDRRFAAQLAQFPEVNAMLIDRLTERTHRLAVAQAIPQLNGVDRRLLALFWHLAERWGRVVPTGVAVTMPISHRLIAQLVGARRPTVSTALAQLARRGELIRTRDQSWLLTGEPIGVPTGEAARVIRARRRRMKAERLPDVAPVADAPAELPLTGRIGELHEVLQGLRSDNERFRQDFSRLVETTQTLVEKLGEDRERRRISAGARR
jgi:CRP/FNR family transcriptional regulator, cyclic AMP receptor protein